MATERKFLAKALNDYSIKEFLESQLSRAGVSAVSVQQTPIATRITISVQRPGIVVGKKGLAISTLAGQLTSKFGLENPQIEVAEVAVPSLDAKLVADRIGHQIELRDNAKQAVRFALREIMGAGAIGAEIRVAGKIVGKGGKAKAFTVRSGYLKKSGELVKLVREGHYTSYPKAGAIGITVKILPPGTKIPDKVSQADFDALVSSESVSVQEVTEPVEKTESVHTEKKTEEKKDESKEKLDKKPKARKAKQE